MESQYYLYKEFVNTISDILTDAKLDKHLLPLNISQDSLYIDSIFLKETKKIINDKKYNEWGDEEFISSMVNIKLGLLSFLEKSKCSLYKIYSIANKHNEMKKFLLLERYKNLIKDILIKNTLIEKEHVYIEESIELDKIERKKNYILRNIRNFKDPKILACLLDIFSYDDFRSSLINAFINKANELNITNMFNSSSEKYSNIEDLITYVKKNNIIEKIINFIMFIDIEKDIIVRKQVKEKINNYIEEFVNNSDIISKYFDNLNKKYKDKNLTLFKSRINLKVLNDIESADFENIYNLSNNLSLEEIPFDHIYTEVFENNKSINFNRKNVIQRIQEIIFYFIEMITIISKQPQSDIVNKINSFISDIVKKINLNESTSDEVKIIINELEEKKLLTNVEKTFDDIFNEYDGKLNNLINNEKNNSLSNLSNYKTHIDNFKKILNDNESMEEDKKAKLKLLIKEISSVLEEIKDIDFSKVSRSEFNYFPKLLNKLIENKEDLKLFILVIFNEKNISSLISKLEKKHLIKINNKISSIIIDDFLKAIEYLLKKTNFDLDSNDKSADFKLFFNFVGNMLDSFIFFYKKWLFSSNNNSNTVKVLKSVVKTRLAYKK